MMSSLFIIGIPRITGTMEVFDSYPAICFAYTVGTKRMCFMKNPIFRNISVSGPEPEEETEENKIEEEEKENKNKNQLLFYKDFRSFLKVLKDYYYLCMVRCY